MGSSDKDQNQDKLEGGVSEDLAGRFRARKCKTKSMLMRFFNFPANSSRSAECLEETYFDGQGFKGIGFECAAETVESLHALEQLGL